MSRSRVAWRVARRARLALLSVLVATAACTKPPRAASSSPRNHRSLTPAVEPKVQKPDVARAFTPKELAEVVKTVMGARRLKLEQPFLIEQLTRSDFDTRREALRPQPAKDSVALTKLVSLVAPEASQRPKRKQGEVVAYYHSPSDTVVLPATTSATRDQGLATFAHEVQHALQHRHFGAAGIQKQLADADESWAFKALMEGDAQVTMAAYLGATHGIPLGRALRRMTDLVAGTPVHSHRDGRMLPTFEGSSARLFPYQEGARFVADLYRTGGFQLVNQAYASRPTSTMHILHPDRYLAGKLPALVTLPDTALGTTIDFGVWGELRTRWVIEQCVGEKSAATLASEWRGDAFRVSRLPSNAKGSGVTFEWVSTWSDAASAIAVEQALRSGPCKTKPPSSAELQPPVMAVTGNQLVFVRGAPSQDQALSAGRVLANSQVESRQRPAISTLSIPPRVTVPRRGEGRIHGRRYENFWLGLTSQWPSGSRASVSKGLLSVTLPTGGQGLLTLYDHVPAGKSLELIYTKLVAQIRRSTGDFVSENRQARRRVKTHLGYSLRRRYKLANGVTMVVDVVPVCASTGAILVTRTSSFPTAERALNRWFGDTRLIAGRNLPACGWLDPK